MYMILHACSDTHSHIGVDIMNADRRTDNVVHHCHVFIVQ
jgi:hypothetical protein